MIRRIFLIGGAIAAALVIVLGGLYFLGERKGGTGSFFARIASGFQTVTGAAHTEFGMPSGEFAFRRLEIDTTKPQAEACLVFTRDLDASGKTHYEDYFSIDPDDPRRRPCRRTAGSASPASSFNTTYNVTLKTGLPAAAGDKLIEAETVPVELRDKPSLVRFSGGIILPRDNADGVPVTTVNIAKLRVKVIRVGDRLLSQIESGVVDQTTLYSWKDSDLENSQGNVVWPGTMDVANVKNDSVVTLIPIHDILKDKQARRLCAARDGCGQEEGRRHYYERRFTTSRPNG